MWTSPVAYRGWQKRAGAKELGRPLAATFIFIDSELNWIKRFRVGAHPVLPHVLPIQWAFKVSPSLEEIRTRGDTTPMFMDTN